MRWQLQLVHFQCIHRKVIAVRFAAMGRAGAASAWAAKVGVGLAGAFAQGFAVCRTWPFYVLYPQNRHQAARVRVLVDSLMANQAVAQ